jgi:hypothetical protein
MMSRIRSFCLAALAAVVLMAAPLAAHHGYAAYDMTKTQALKGTITRFRLVNPHSQLEFDVKAANGEIEHWIVETGATVRSMTAAGATRDTFKPGDVVTVHFYPAHNGSRIGALQKVEFADGHVFDLSPKPGE